MNLSPVPGSGQHLGIELLQRAQLEVGHVIGGLIEEMGRRHRNHAHAGGPGRADAGHRVFDGVALTERG